jgi:hypothetical protein
MNKTSNSQRGAGRREEVRRLVLIRSDEQGSEAVVAQGNMRMRRLYDDPACCQRHRLGSEGKAEAVRGESQVTGAAVVRLTAGDSRGGARVARRHRQRGPEVARSTRALATTEGGSHAPTPPKAGPSHQADGGQSTSEQPGATGTFASAHGGLCCAEKDWVAGGRASALTPPALHEDEAQLAEHRIPNPTVPGSTPGGLATYTNNMMQGPLTVVGREQTDGERDLQRVSVGALGIARSAA